MLNNLEIKREEFKEVKYSEHSVWRGKIIDDIIQKYNFSSYLEIGYLDGLTFNQINLKNKVSVDPSPRNYNSLVITKTSDEFFSENVSKFDIVFIDGYHEKFQVYQDFQNSFRFLNDDGIIIFHDVNPFTESGTSQMGNGDCYQTWMNLYENYKLQTYSNYHDSIGIFSKKINPIFKEISLKDYSWSEFELNRNKYIYDLQISDDLNLI